MNSEIPVIDTMHQMKGCLCGQDSEQNTPCDYCGRKKACRVFVPNAEHRTPFFDVCATCRKKFFVQEDEEPYICDLQEVC